MDLNHTRFFRINVPPPPSKRKTEPILIRPGNFFVHVLPFFTKNSWNLVAPKQRFSPGNTTWGGGALIRKTHCEVMIILNTKNSGLWQRATFNWGVLNRFPVNCWKNSDYLYRFNWHPVSWFFDCRRCWAGGISSDLNWPWLGTRRHQCFFVDSNGAWKRARSPPRKRWSTCWVPSMRNATLHCWMRSSICTNSDWATTDVRSPATKSKASDPTFPAIACWSERYRLLLRGLGLCTNYVTLSLAPFYPPP